MTETDASKVSSARPGRPLLRRRWARRLGWAAAVVAALLVALWLGAPPLIKWQGQKIASEKLGRPVQIGAVQCAPWALALTLHDVSVAGAAPADPPQFAFRRLHARLALESILRLAPVVRAVELDEPALRLRHLGNGRYDVDDILARLTSSPKPPPPDEKPARFAAYDIAVQGGSITFIDEPVRRTHEVRDLRLALPFISNLPSRLKTNVTPQLAFTLDGSRFDSSAQTLPFDDSLHTQAEFRLERLDLAPYLAYQPASLPLRLTAGALDADLRLAFEQTPEPSLQITGALNLSGVKVSDAAGQQALAFDRLAIQASDMRPLEHTARLASVELSAPRVLASRDAQGRLNWAASAAPPAAAPAQATASAPKKVAAQPAGADDGWRLRVDRLSIAQGDLQWRDAQPAPGVAQAASPAALHVAPFSFEAKNLNWPATEAATFSGQLALADVPAEPLAPPKQARGKNAKKPAPQKTAPPPAPTPVAIAAAASAASAPAIAFEGQAQMTAAKAHVQARGLPLQLARPYLAAFLKPTLAGRVDAEADLSWQAAEAGGKNAGLTVQAGKLAFSRLALLGDTAADAPTASPGKAGNAPRDRQPARNLPELPPGTLASVAALTLEGARLDLPGQSVAVDAVTVLAPRTRVLRDRRGRWMFEDWLAQPAAAPRQVQAASAPARPWAVRVARIALEGGEIGWRDQQPATGAVEVALAQVKLEARGFDLGGGKPMPLEFSALLAPRRGEPGKLSWRGALGIAPVSAQGELDAERLPLQAFEPYVAGQLNIDILRADASFKGKLDYTQQRAGPRLRVTGDARIEELRTTSHPGSAAANDAPPDDAPGANAALAPDAGAAGLGEELLSWKQLRVAGLDVQLDPGQPPRIATKQSRLSDFYARIVVHPNGRINLQDLVKSDAPAQTPAASAPAKEPVMHFGATHLVNGRIAFSDHFIRPNYSADLSELNGSLGAFSSVANPQAPQMADLQLTGRAEGTAQLAVSGKLNPLAHPLALDIAAKVTDLELPPLSPYAIKYSGHGIERGKLSMDVAYKITPDGQLTAANRLTLNQLQFGEQAPDAQTSLPVSLATALLADSNGVINLDLPISGSLNDPQFSIGPVIFKAIVGLIGKAITAPFSLLANALGGGGAGDPSQVPFEPGSAALSDAARTQLDQIAKAMTSRPQIKLTVTGAARLDQELEPLKRQRLLALVAAERRAGDGGSQPAAAAASEAASAPQPPASAEAEAEQAPDADYPQLLRRLYRRADLPDKPRNFIGMTKDAPAEQMEALLLKQITVSEDDIRQLAAQRAVAVKNYLLAQQLSAERVFIGAAKTQDTPAPASAAEPAASAPATAPAAPWTPHAELALSAR